MKSRVFIVFLRRPGKDDARRDPFWEFGSFGCTRCHNHNLLHPVRSRVRDGDKLAFVQGGPLVCRLLLVTPPVKRMLHYPGDGDSVLEIRWKPALRPFAYSDAAPLLAGETARKVTRFPKMRAAISMAKRSTWEGKLASCFRARAEPLKRDIAKEILTAFAKACRKAPSGAFIKTYTDALPWFEPEAITMNRRRDYQKVQKGLLGLGKQARSNCRKVVTDVCR